MAVTGILKFGGEICGDLEQGLRREWLVTNGLGGFGCGTLAGCQTRRYHGLLVAAEHPPVVRTMLLVDLDPVARVDGRVYELSCHEYEGGVIHPRGNFLIESFELDGTVPTWTYALGAARLTKCVFMASAANTTYVTFTLERALAPVALTIRPLCTGRDYHSHRRGAEGYQMTRVAGGCIVAAQGVAARLMITADSGEFVAAPYMQWNLRHRLEAARGLDSTEDLYSPGTFELTMSQGETVSFTATIEAQSRASGVVLADLRAREAQVLEGMSAAAPDWVRQLALGADQFIVARAGVTDGKSVIAGYPWFSDWGRDTMIALPGLMLSTGRFADAAAVLRTFARYVNDGLLPNQFPDSGVAPEYNTVDATLWYFVAIYEYVQATDDITFAQEIFPVLNDIIAWHRRGTRHRIAVDSGDGLLYAGEPGVQLTWMDAKVDQWVVTPRIGKPVEINALWCNALWIAAQIAIRVGDTTAAKQLSVASRTTADTFASRFWFDDGQHLYDVIDSPTPPNKDTSLRPNQLIALALPYQVIEESRARLALRACERDLLTPYGLRTLDPEDPHYVAHYGGDPRQRDGAYHQGTVWAWLLGSFARAHFTLYGDARQAASYLAPLEQHLRDGCIGQISEIFDADPPHAPQGCFAQAWSVAEVLRAWLEIQRPAPQMRPPSANCRSYRVP
jgi:predicted glycogen debranching enzyme